MLFKRQSEIKNGFFDGLEGLCQFSYNCFVWVDASTVGGLGMDSKESPVIGVESR